MAHGFSVRGVLLCFLLASETFCSTGVSGAFAALRGFRRRWADPEPGPESALAAALEPDLLSVTPDSASRSNGSFCLVEPEGASVTSSSPMGLLPAFDIVGQQPCNSLPLGQSVLRRLPLHGREWAPQRDFRPVLQYRPLRGPLFASRCSPMARVEQPLPPPVYRGAVLRRFPRLCLLAFLLRFFRGRLLCHLRS